MEKLTNSIKCSRTFKAWLVELRAQARKRKAELEDLDLNRAKMFYNGGYSPKMVIDEELRIPV
jgi:hypothetical protein